MLQFTKPALLGILLAAMVAGAPFLVLAGTPELLQLLGWPIFFAWLGIISLFVWLGYRLTSR
jgi:hypothetical protein